MRVCLCVSYITEICVYLCGVGECEKKTVHVSKAVRRENFFFDEEGAIILSSQKKPNTRNRRAN